MPVDSQTPLVVVDANIVLAATFPDEARHTLALDFLAELGKVGARVMAPPLWESETSSAVRMRVQVKKTTPPADEARAYAFLDSLPIEIVQDSQIKTAARDLAIQLGLPRVYDATYLALAQGRGALLWTADERLFNAAQNAPLGALSFVRFLGTFTPGQNPSAAIS